MLKGLGVDVLTFPDSPSGRTRIELCAYGAESQECNGF